MVGNTLRKEQRNVCFSNDQAASNSSASRMLFAVSAVFLFSSVILIIFSALLSYLNDNVQTLGPEGIEARQILTLLFPWPMILNRHFIAFQITSFLIFTFSDNMGPYDLPPPPNCGGGGADKTEGSNTIMSTSFALKFWYNKISDVDIIQSITLTVS